MQVIGNTYKGSCDSPFVLIENTKQDEGRSFPANKSFSEFKISTPSGDISLTLICNTEKAYLADLVPVAHEVCDIINRHALDNVKQKGGKVSCQKGCANCCAYLVSLSSAEVFHMHRHVLSLDGEFRKPILHSFLRAARKIAANKLPAANNFEMDGLKSLDSISQWYQKMEIKCPFLENNSCSQYQTRPLVCREYLVTTPPSSCDPNSKMMTDIIELPVSTAEVLMHVSNQIESTTDEAILLPLAMVWCNSNSRREEKVYSSSELAEEFVKAISAKTPATV